MVRLSKYLTLTAALLLALGNSALAAETVTGTLAAIGPARPDAPARVALAVGETRYLLSGELAKAHLPMLSALTVKISGSKTKDGYAVDAYEIVDVGGGRKPQLGYVRCLDGVCGIEPLSITVIDTMEPAAATGSQPIPVGAKGIGAKISKSEGALIWFLAKTTPEGIKKVMRFGVIQDAKKKGVNNEQSN